MGYHLNMANAILTLVIVSNNKNCSILAHSSLEWKTIQRKKITLCREVCFKLLLFPQHVINLSNNLNSQTDSCSRWPVGMWENW